MSNLYQFEVKTSENNTQQVIVTAQRTNNDTYGNPRYAVQVWIHRPETFNAGNLWCPKVKGHKLNKNDQYIIQSYNLDDDIQGFIQEFEKAVQA
jgi:hypothetical protein